MSTLRVENEKQPKDPKLESAVMLSVHSSPAHRDRVPLQQWLRTRQPMNQRMLCGLLRSICKLRVEGSEPNRHHCLAVLEYLVETGQYETFKNDVAKLRPLWDATLFATFLESRRQRRPMEDFWALYGHLTQILGLHIPFDVLMLATGSWHEVEKELKQVVGSSDLGKKMFGGSLRNSAGALAALQAAEAI